LLKAQELGLKIFSYPEYLYEQSKGKTRVVVGGSHGKTTTTAMILHVLQHCGIEADYMVGAQLEGFEVMVRLSETAKVMVIEGDEYLTSPIDRRPKFHLYKPHVAIVTGIEWDHINVFPTFEIYKDQFAQFVNLIEPGGRLIYCNDDPEVRDVAQKNTRTDIAKQPYDVPPHEVVEGITYLNTAHGRVPLRVFGNHNLLNLTAARYACNSLGVTDEQFDEAIQSFGGASKRLELVKATEHCAVYKDFAHAPSKLRATIAAMKGQYPDRRLVACMELHTFSSLTAEFLKQYAGTMDRADVPFVYYSQHALQLKKLPDLDPEQVKASFANDKVRVFTDSKQMVDAVIQIFKQSGSQAINLLMMSSGNFDGIDFKQLADELI
jgi:UDP-N-acetylmuramate: L-alanyl-gamma-D-glutamyl-meso-diaminopimelate ligase